jgi:hypothetical protein
MRKFTVLTLTAVFVVLAISAINAAPEPAIAKDNTDKNFEAPQVFQAAGPNTASLQGTLDAYRAALGNPNNLNLGPQADGHREINWDGAVAGTDTTTDPVTPFNTFLNTRGAQFTTPGVGLSQAPVSGGPQGGLVQLFANDSYGTTFAAFSTLRVFTPVGSNVTNGFFFSPVQVAVFKRL